MLNPIDPRPITVPQLAATAPVEVYIGDLTGAYVLITQAGTNTTGTFQVQVSNDRTNWFTVGADISAAANRSLAADYAYVRVDCTVDVTGAGNVFTATVAGRKVYV